MQTGDGRPPGSHAALLDWPDASSVDAGPPPCLAAALAAALVGYGPVAFRWTGPRAWPADAATVLRAQRPGMLRASLDRLASRWATDLVLTQDATAAAALFTHDWEGQGQAALLLPTAEALTPALRETLATCRRWTATPLPDAVTLLTPAVDGAALHLAAATGPALLRLTERLATTLGEHHIGWAEA